MPPTHDASVFLWAIGGLVALIAMVIGLHRLARHRARQAPAAELDEAKLAEIERQREVERQRQRAAEARARSELEQAVKDGRALPDGRIACHASAKCMLPATHQAPSIARDNGFSDFIRTRFGAPNRYRMVVKKHKRPFFGDDDDAPKQDPNALYCETHIHVARQVCLAQLAADEQAQQSHLMSREAALAAFEARGMLGDVQRLVLAAEEQQTTLRPPPSLGSPSPQT